MKFIVLTENHEADGLKHEHGLSLFIEYKGKQYLLDAGQSDAFAENAEKLGLNLKNTEFAVLSHAHYDHAGGLNVYLDQNAGAVVYAAEAGQRMDWYSRREDGMKYIGIPQEILELYAERFVWSKGIQELVPGMWLIPHSTPGLEKIGEKTGMYRKNIEVEAAIMNPECPPCQEHMVERFVPDDFLHEQSLVVEIENGLVIFNSCSHGGVANIVEEVRTAFPARQICAYIGGFHLKAPGSETAMNCSEEEERELGRSLLKLGIRQIYTGHCTGVRGYEILKEEMGECLQELRTGLQVELY